MRLFVIRNKARDVRLMGLLAVGLYAFCGSKWDETPMVEEALLIIGVFLAGIAGVLRAWAILYVAGYKMETVQSGGTGRIDVLHVHHDRGHGRRGRAVAAAAEHRQHHVDRLPQCRRAHRRCRPRRRAADAGNRAGRRRWPAAPTGNSVEAGGTAQLCVRSRPVARWFRATVGLAERAPARRGNTTVSGRGSIARFKPQRLQAVGAVIFPLAPRSA